MHALGLEAFLVDAGLEAFVQELVEGETQDVIELEFLIGEQTVSVHSVEQGSTFEQSSRVFLLEGKQFSGGLAETGQQEMHSPHLPLVLEAVLADQLQLVVDPLLLEGTTGSVEGGRV